MSRLLDFKSLCEAFGHPSWSRSEDSDVSARSVQIITDTRALLDQTSLASGDSLLIFCALKGARFDGHDYLSQAIAAGVAGIIIEHDRMSQTQLNDLAGAQASSARAPLAVFAVDNTEAALQALAKHVRHKFLKPVVSLTGSCGKTTVKEWLASIVDTAQRSLKTAGNLNNELGVPFTLFRLDSEHDVAIIEAGAGKVGDIELLSQIISPTIALVNNIQDAHLQGFGSRKAIAEEKACLYTSKKLQHAVVNLDDDFLEYFIEVIKKNPQAIKLTGFAVSDTDDSTADFELETLLSASKLSADSRGCYRFTLTHRQDQKVQLEQSIQLNVPGKHQVSNALAAASLALCAGFPIEALARALSLFKGVKGRMRLHALTDLTLVDDSYNANPGSVRAAIDYLATCKRAWLVLGDMAELGDRADSLHYQTGTYAQNKLERLYSVGKLSRHAQTSFLSAKALQDKTLRHFETRQALINALTIDIEKVRAANDDQVSPVVLVKGSRSAGLEEVVNAFLPESASC